MKILVTGGAGFIGSHLCDKLLKEGHFVVCLDNLSDYYDPKIKIANIEHNLENPNFIFEKNDITDYGELNAIFKKYSVNAIIHLAARAGVRASLENPFGFRETNVDGTINLLEGAKTNEINKFIFGSSSSVYGNNKKIPFYENDPVNEPISPYAASKQACELYCYAYNHNYGIKIAVLRFFNVFGPRNRPDMAHFTFTDAITKGDPIKKYGDGSTARDYTYIDDIVEGIIKTLNADFNFEIFNLGNSHPVSLNNMIKTLEKTLGKHALIEQLPDQPGDAAITFADNSKAKRLLNWEPKTPYEEGVKKLVEWYKSANK